MALQADRINIGGDQKARVRRSMRRMARDTAFGFDHRVLKGKWSRRLRMALATNRILVGGRPQVLVLECTVRIMAVAACHQPFVHLVVEGLCERRFNIRMAGIAKLRLGDLQQARLIHGTMHAMATDAAYPCLAVGRAFKVGMRRCVAA